MNAEYVIGIDGGGTKTHLVAVDRKMKVLSEGYGGSSNLSSSSSDTVRKNISVLLNDFFLESGFSLADCAGVCLGTAGAGRESARKELRFFLERALGPCRLYVTNDAEGALAGGTESESGILLTAGTGSLCYARNEQGETRRVGGWGHIMGDEGSGYDMACRMLRAVVRAGDGRGEPTLLTDLVLEHWSMSGIDDLVDGIYRSGKGKGEIASLAPLCDIAYENNDKTAFRIMEGCAGSLAEMVAVAAGIFGEGETIVCACSGSLLERSRYLKSHLREQLHRRRPEIALTACIHDAAWGCARLAWERAALSV